MELEEVGGNRWFNRELIRKVGNGLETYFWKDAWITSVPFMESFPRLFTLANCQDVKVGEVWERNAVGERWGLRLCGKGSL